MAAVLVLLVTVGLLSDSTLGAPEESCSAKPGSGCCLNKLVGSQSYAFSHVSKDVHSGCQDKCLYTRDGDDPSNLWCFSPGHLEERCINCKLPGLSKKYSQPGDKSWPNTTEITAFKKLIFGTNKTSCLGLDRFVDFSDPAAHNQTICLKYTGLQLNNSCKSTGSYQSPHPKCDENPFITGAHYAHNGTACMTPYQFLNNRNFKKEWMAAFIVTANTTEDIQAAVRFARTYNLGISVINTGHDMQDRNAGPGPNTLLIRTTCFRDWEVRSDPITDPQNKTWTEGYAVVGAGLSFGENFWTDLNNSVGTYELAARANKEMVGGTCHSVGIVGWSMGGGRGWTSPMYGLGVDQLCHVDLVNATGHLTSANVTHNSDLFYAIRGGGHGFGIIYSIKIKLHNSTCGDSMKDCYKMHKIKWEGSYKSNSTPGYIKNITRAYVKWSIKYRHKKWNSLYQLHYNTSTKIYSLTIFANHFGKDQDPSFSGTFHDNFTTDRIFFNPIDGKACTTEQTEPECSDIWNITTDKYWCEIFPDYKNGSNCTLGAWQVTRLRQTIRFMVNSSVENNTFIDDLISTWQPLCEANDYSPCASGYQIHGDLPAIKDGVGVYASNTPLSEGFRTASFQVFNFDVNCEKVDLTFIQKEEWMHSVLGPALYPYSNASYFNEAEYTLEPGQWERRFWGEKNHCQLLRTKMKYDPTFTFGCRHCVGSEVGSQPSK